MGRLRFQFYCSFCNKAIKGHAYKVMAYRYTEPTVLSSCHYRLCGNCYSECQRAVRQVLVRIRIAKLQESWGYVKPHTAEKI
jgi:hypothetical protein